MEDRKKEISVIIPVCCEEKYIDGFMDSLLNQSVQREKMEWIFACAASGDRTWELLKGYEKQYPGNMKLYENPKRIQAAAMNLGIRLSEGKYIIRMDVHAKYPPDYIEKCLWYLEHTDAANVGGFIETQGKTKMAGRIAKVLSSPFGVGNSRFRIQGKGGAADTVPFGAFRRSILEKIGGFDERLCRNEDNEINYRIRSHGGTVYLAEDIRSVYYCRETLAELCRMAFQNGKWNVITADYIPGAMGVRHFVPLLFLLSLIIFLSGSFRWKKVRAMLEAELLLYGTLSFMASKKETKTVREALGIWYLFPVFHLTYGVGSMAGFLCNRKFRWNPLLHKKGANVSIMRTRAKRNLVAGDCARMCQGTFFSGLMRRKNDDDRDSGKRIKKAS